MIFAQTSQVSAPHLLQLKGLVLYIGTILPNKIRPILVNLQSKEESVIVKKSAKNSGCPVMQMFVVGSISTLTSRKLREQQHELRCHRREKGAKQSVPHLNAYMAYFFTLPITHHYKTCLPRGPYPRKLRPHSSRKNGFSRFLKR